MKKLIHLFLCLIWLQNCSSYRVVNFINEDHNFGQFETFRLENLKRKRVDTLPEKPPLIAQLEEALIAEMRERKYVLTERNTDLVLRYEIITNNRSELDVNPFPARPSLFFPYGYYYNINERNFTESILLLELKLPHNNKIVWQGSLDMRYSRRSKKSENIVIDAVNKIFETYSYEAGNPQPVRAADNS